MNWFHLVLALVTIMLLQKPLERFCSACVDSVGKYKSDNTYKTRDQRLNDYLEFGHL